MRVTAAVLHAVNKPYSVETVDRDAPRRGEVVVKVAAAGVCRSDLHFQKGEATIAMPGDEHARTSGKLYDNTSRLHTLAGQDCTHMGKVACFAEYAVVPEMLVFP